VAIFFNRKIISEKTLGERLRMLRRRKRLTLEEAEEETKVRLKYLQALENDRYGELPADVYAQGFLTKYVDFLGAPKEEILEIFKRERRRNFSPGMLVPQAQIKEKRAILTPKIIIFCLVFLVLAVFLGYIFYAVRNFTSPPNLEVSSPSTETVIRSDKVEVVGKTDEGASLKINDQTVFLDDRGNFKEEVKLQAGLNNIELRSTNRAQKETIKVIKILAEY